MVFDVLTVHKYHPGFLKSVYEALQLVSIPEPRVPRLQIIPTLCPEALNPKP